MISDSYRFVFVLQSCLKPSVKEMDYVDINEVAPLLIDRVNKGESLKLYESETLLYRIRDAQIKDERYFVMLISLGDKNVSDPSFENFETGTVRQVPKAVDEGQSYAAHMVIDLESLASDKPLNTVSLERVPGLSVGKVRMFLRHEIKQVFKKEYINVNSEKKTYTATLELDGHFSHTLGDALKTGTLKHVSLIEYETQQDGFDEPDYTVEKKNSIDVKINSETPRSKNLNVFNRIYERFINSSETNKYDTMVVRIKTAQGVTKQNILELNENENLLSQAFYHQKMIDGFTSDLDASPKIIRDDVVAKMIRLMKDKDA